MDETTHQRRLIPSGSFDSVTGRSGERDDPGPMGLRCLHPLDPAGVFSVPIAFALIYSTEKAIADAYTRCAFDGCVCRCHGEYRVEVTGGVTA